MSWAIYAYLFLAVCNLVEWLAHLWLSGPPALLHRSILEFIGWMLMANTSMILDVIRTGLHVKIEVEESMSKFHSHQGMVI